MKCPAFRTKQYKLFSVFPALPKPTQFCYTNSLSVLCQFPLGYANVQFTLRSIKLILISNVATFK